MRQRFPWIIAVDFDGTLAEKARDGIGAPIFEVIDAVKERQAEGCAVILWTCREGPRLEEAVGWCRGFGLVFDAVNENLPYAIEYFGEDSRKVFADEYWDDKAWR